MGTKNNPGKFDCHAAAEPDEPMFVLLGRDPMAPLLVKIWAALRERAGEDLAKVQEAQECAVAMEVWAKKLGKEDKLKQVGDFWVDAMLRGKDLGDAILGK